jgi:hypothetical protein
VTLSKNLITQNCNFAEPAIIDLSLIDMLDLLKELKRKSTQSLSTDRKYPTLLEFMYVFSSIDISLSLNPANDDLQISEKSVLLKRLRECLLAC